MGSIFAGRSITSHTTSSVRRSKYLSEKKTDRRPNEKRELNEQLAYCAWFKLTFPDVHFRADTSAGDWNNKLVKHLDTLQRSEKGLPDISIYAARHGYHAFMPEFKATGEHLKMRRNGTKIKVRKDKRGRIIERDYKIRLIGDWKDLHTERQAKRHEELRTDGFLADFYIGLEELKKATCWYFDVPYTPPPENEELF